MKLTEKQLAQINDKGIDVAALERQLSRFKNGFPGVTLERAAVINDGILQISEQRKTAFIKSYEDQANHLELLKFVPASGAATRMFKFLHQFVNSYNPDEESINAYINKNDARELFTFFIAIEKFPFYNEIIVQLKEQFPDWLAKPDRIKKLLFIKHLLTDAGMNYGNMPKGLVPFHQYKDHSATAFEEHLFEASIYAASNNVAKLHFTIAPAFKGHFKSEFDRIEHIVEKKTNTSIEIDFSYQQEHTDTIAVDNYNHPVVTEDGLLFFRPSGHGALLANLNDLEADVLFIKNIDNVTVSSLEQEVASYKKMLAGLLLELQQQSYEYLKLIDDAGINHTIKANIEQFLQQELGAVFPKDYVKYSESNQLEYLHDRLNRPLRICGMVKNEGEPGGGPFWVKNQKGEISLEIVESAQVDKKDKKQQQIFKSGTHFNPVDIVCGLKDYRGNKFDLLNYCDPDTGFITYKSRLGKDIKAQERPGLWNGGMAYWNTVFVEVPLLTFNPVKTVNDLLKPAHQN